MSTTAFHPTASDQTLVYQDDREGTQVVLDRRPMTLQQYLHSSFHPDQEYADGYAEERSMGEYEHGRVQSFFDRYFGAREKEWGLRVVAECRLQVASGRFRVPDVLVLRAGTPARPYPKTAPLICIEVLSPEDRFLRLRVRLEDYRKMGVENIWVLDPESRNAFVYTAEGYREVSELAVAELAISIPVSEVFSLLDDE